MNLKHLSADQLVTQLKNLCSEERRITSKILHYLREVEARRLYEPRYTSLFDYCVQELGYSNDAAQRRIASMRLLKVMPEFEAQVQSGDLTLAVLAKAQSYFSQETKLRKMAHEPALNLEEKRVLVTALVGKSKRQAEEILIAHSINPEQKRSLKLELSAEDSAKLDQLRALLSHRLVENSASGLVSLLIEEALDKHDPARKADRATARAEKNATQAAALRNTPPESNPAPRRTPQEGHAEGALEIKSKYPLSHPYPHQQRQQRQHHCENTHQHQDKRQKLNKYQIRSFGSSAEVKSNGAGSETENANAPRTRHIPAEIKRLVWLRDQGKCTEPGCGATNYLHVDHRLPFALGGAHTPDNLRLLCSAHNHRAADKIFGPWKN